MNKIMTFVFAVAGFLSAGAATPISSGEEFVVAMSNPTGEYVLTRDINLDGCGYSSVAEFSGLLDGAGHTITGLGAQALFQKCTGTVMDVVVDGSIGEANTERVKTGCAVIADEATGASFIGCVVKGYTLKHGTQRQELTGNGFIVGTANNGCSFVRCLAAEGCELEQDGFGGNSQGGIVGVMLLDGAGTLGSFSACTNYAKIASSKSPNPGNGYGGLGGVVGMVKCTKDDGKNVPLVEFTDCVNYGNIVVENDTSATSLVGGMAGHLRGYNFQTSLQARFSGCVNYGALATSRYAQAIGGMVGTAEERCGASFDSCVNRGNMGGLRTVYAGGILGYCKRFHDDDPFTFINCANYGSVSAGTGRGGLFAQAHNAGFGDGIFEFRNSANYGELKCDAGQSPVSGEIAGGFTKDSANLAASILIDNCWRMGDESAVGSMDATSTLTETHGQTSKVSSETALAALNSVVRETEGYVKWKIWDTGYPELLVPGAVGPAPDPVASLSDVVATVSRDGLSADLSVTVGDVTVVDGVLRLELNGKTIHSWPLAEGSYQFAQKVKRGREYAYSFVAEAAQPDPDTTMFIEGSFLPIGEADWFAVRFSDTGYVPGPSWMSESVDPSGGTWSGVAGETELDAGTRTVSFVKTATAPAVYAPKRSSKAGAGVLISGRIRVGEVEDGSLAEGVPFAFGFAFDEAMLRYRPYVIANGVKTPFGDASLTYHAWVDYSVEGTPADNGTWTVKAVVGGIASDPVSVTVPSASVTSVGFAGGTFGDFKGLFKFFKNPGGMALLVR